MSTIFLTHSELDILRQMRERIEDRAKYADAAGDHDPTVGDDERLAAITETIGVFEAAQEKQRAANWLCYYDGREAIIDLRGRTLCRSCASAFVQLDEHDEVIA